MENEDSVDDVKRTLRIKKHADGLIPASAERSIRFLAWVCGGIFMSAASIITGTIFVISIKSDISNLKERVGKTEGFIEGAKPVIQQMATSETIKNTETMWNQRKLGVSNKEVFYIEHGFAPPSISAAQPISQPSPRPAPSPSE